MKFLRQKDFLPDPFDQFSRWFHTAEKKLDLEEAPSMTVSTIDTKGFPEARVVLLKSFDPQGFVFYTNLQSPKGISLLNNHRVALTFHWFALGRQIRIQGTAAQVTDAEADAYFRTRPTLSQLGAWASEQSRPLDSRLTLVKRVARLKWKFRGQNIPRPPHWSGFRVTPRSFEFWQAGPFRLHDRFLYTPKGSGWTITRLNP